MIDVPVDKSFRMNISLLSLTDFLVIQARTVSIVDYIDEWKYNKIKTQKIYRNYFILFFPFIYCLSLPFLCPFDLLLCFFLSLFVFLLSSFHSYEYRPKIHTLRVHSFLFLTLSSN